MFCLWSTLHSCLLCRVRYFVINRIKTYHQWHKAQFDSTHIAHRSTHYFLKTRKSNNFHIFSFPNSTSHANLFVLWEVGPPSTWGPQYPAIKLRIEFYCWVPEWLRLCSLGFFRILPGGEITKEHKCPALGDPYNKLGVVVEKFVLTEEYLWRVYFKKIFLHWAYGKLSKYTYVQYIRYIRETVLTEFVLTRVNWQTRQLSWVYSSCG